MIVTVNATIMSGTVVRWYTHIGAYNAAAPLLSASREGVHVDGWLHDVEPLLAAAHSVHAALRADARADVSGYATHRQSVLGRRCELVAIEWRANA